MSSDADALNRWLRRNGQYDHYEDTRLSKRAVYSDVYSHELVDAIDAKQTYPILGHNRQIVQTVEARYCCMLATRRLVVGTIRETEAGRVLTSIRVAPTVTVNQVKNVLKLKPSRISICNRAESIEVGASMWWHTRNMGLLGEKVSAL